MVQEACLKDGVLDAVFNFLIFLEKEGEWMRELIGTRSSNLWYIMFLVSGLQLYRTSFASSN